MIEDRFNFINLAKKLSYALDIGYVTAEKKGARIQLKLFPIGVKPKYNGPLSGWTASGYPVATLDILSMTAHWGIHFSGNTPLHDLADFYEAKVYTPEEYTKKFLKKAKKAYGANYAVFNRMPDSNGFYIKLSKGEPEIDESGYAICDIPTEFSRDNLVTLEGLQWPVIDYSSWRYSNNQIIIKSEDDPT